GASDPAHGRELWSSDGTEAGTTIVADLAPGIFDSIPSALTPFGPWLFFAADDGIAGHELWAIVPPTITNDDGLAIVSAGQPLTYTVTVANPSGQDLNTAAVSDSFPGLLAGVTWTCAATRGAVCTAAGAGDIVDVVDLPAQGRLVYLATGTVSPLATGT